MEGSCIRAGRHAHSMAHRNSRPHLQVVYAEPCVEAAPAVRASQQHQRLRRRPQAERTRARRKLGGRRAGSRLLQPQPLHLAGQRIGSNALRGPARQHSRRACCPLGRPPSFAATSWPGHVRCSLPGPPCLLCNHPGGNYLHLAPNDVQGVGHRLCHQPGHAPKRQHDGHRQPGLAVQSGARHLAAMRVMVPLRQAGAGWLVKGSHRCAPCGWATELARRLQRHRAGQRAAAPLTTSDTGTGSAATLPGGPDPQPRPWPAAPPATRLQLACSPPAARLSLVLRRTTRRTCFRCW